MEKLDHLGVPLSAGRTADIYRWRETEVIKLYQPWMPGEAIAREQNNTRVARSMGLPVPSVGNLVTYAGRTGLILERLPGETMMRRLERDGARIAAMAEKLAALHLALHAIAADDRLPAQHALLHAKIAGCGRLPVSTRAAVLAALARLPEGDRLCHGDFHPGNVIMAPAQSYIIDWIDAARGNPAADLARSSVLFLGHIAATSVAATERQAMELFHRTYLEAYLGHAHVARDEYDRWLAIQAAARLGEGIARFDEWLLARVREEFES